MKTISLDEQIRQSLSRINNINYVIDNMIIRDYILQLDKDDECTTFRDLLKHKSEELIKFFKKHDLYKSLIKEEKDYSDFKIKLCLENFTSDYKTYAYSTIFNTEGVKGDLHCVTGNDGDLQYIFICSECGTIIIDDHSAEYQLNCPTLLCPVCNELKDDSKYPFEFITNKDEKYYNMLFHYSYDVHKQLLTDKQLKEMINHYASFESNIFKRLYKRFIIKRNFKKQIRQKFNPMDYIAGTDMSNVELKYLNKEE